VRVRGGTREEHGTGQSMIFIFLAEAGGGA
jgi:hypothetical protein